MHGVAMYQADPRAYWQKAMAYVKPGGYFSILEKGRYAVVERFKSRKDDEGLQQFLASGQFRNNMNREVSVLAFEDIEETVKDLGGMAVFKAGVCVDCDGFRMSRAEFGEQAFEALLKRERSLSTHAETINLGHMLHVIAQKL